MQLPAAREAGTGNDIAGQCSQRAAARRVGIMRGQ